ncbi:MAG: molybdopterin-dependent oxidoreductase [Acidobacteria bacterium]|nr:molybdopterin-dependent oxidoreductase [Acidobacteriota bacterium]
MTEYQSIGKAEKKIDGLSLATGTGRFTADFTADQILHLALCYSPHAHALIRAVDLSPLEEMDGVVDVFYHANVPRILHSTAGQGYPEPSPYDAVLFDHKVRFVGDRVAMVAAETREIARAAAQRIQVDYEMLEPVFDPVAALADGPQVAAEDAHAVIPAVYRPEENLAAQVEIQVGNPDAELAVAEFVERHDYETQYAAHCALEPHAVLATFDENGRLVIITSTQVPFHARRIVSRLLQLPPGRVRIVKPRIGGGFGGKQEVFLEPLAALAALKHGRPARLVLSRREVFRSSRTRHPMQIRMSTGVGKDGRITALTMDAVMNTGAYGSHALTVLSNAGSKVLPLLNKIEHLRFFGRSAYTNLPVGGAYRGYGATQGYFALGQQVDIITRRTGQDILKFYKTWHIKSGETSPVFEALGEGKAGVGQIIRSCTLSECIDRGAAALDWYAKRDRHLPAGKDRVKGVGMAVAMQGSGIPRVDMASAAMKLNEDGSFNLHVGATDLGTGSDTILAQIAAEVLQVDLERIVVLSSDTDLTPFDTGAYASSTTYVSGNAVRLCAESLREKIVDVAGAMLQQDPAGLHLRRNGVQDADGTRKLTIAEIAACSLYRQNQVQLQAQASFVGDESPPPFIAQFAEVDVDIRTGRVVVTRFVSAVDCGQPIHPRLAEGQVEGAVVNGISYALCEEMLFDQRGRTTNASFWDYKIFTAADIPELVTILVESHEETGPFGAKSVGEIAINGPLPAIANAIVDAVGVRLFRAPFTQERVFRALEEKRRREAAGGP